MRLDIILPAHNEEDRISPTLHRYRRAIPDESVRFLVAMDGCTDGTAAVVAEHAHVDPRVRARDYPKLGKGGVLSEALRASTAPLVGFVDADGATPPSEMIRLAEAVVDGTDLAIASRRMSSSVVPARRSVARRMTSAGFAASIRHLFGLPFADTQCGAKVMTHTVAGQLVPLLSSRDFLFDVDLLVTAHRLGLDIAEVPTVWVDKDGSKLDVARDTRRMASSAVRLWLHHRVIPVEVTSHPREVVALDERVPTGRQVTDDRLVGA